MRNAEPGSHAVSLAAGCISDEYLTREDLKKMFPEIRPKEDKGQKKEEGQA